MRQRESDAFRPGAGIGTVHGHVVDIAANALNMSQSFKDPLRRIVQAQEAAVGVLEAERVALDGVEQCRQTALALVAATRARAGLLHDRTDTRIQRLRQRMTAAAQVRLERISRETAALAGETDADTSILELLGIAIARVSEELAGTPESR